MKAKKGAERRWVSPFLAAVCTALALRLSLAARGAPSSPSKQNLPSSDSLFAEGPEGSRNLVIVGRFLAADDTRLHLAAALLARGAGRLRAEGTPDSRAEVLLGETAERLAGRPGAPPEGVAFAAPFDPKLGRNVRVYDGEAFRRALGDLPADAARPFVELRERALAGALRARFPLPGQTLIGKWEEATAWLTFAESVETPRVAEEVSRRLERAAPDLARLLLAAGKLDDLASLGRRLTDASARLEALDPDPAKGRRLLVAAKTVRKLRGDGATPFPQEVWLTLGPGAAIVRIEGDIGDLALVVSSGPDAPPTARTRRVLHAPVLPVPGSLALTTDRRAATWLEVETPTRLARVAVALDGSGPVTVTDRDIRAGSSSPRKSSRRPRRTGK